jgi:gluconokinase
VVVILMGVSGSGKTTIGTLLAQALDLPFLDADDFHDAANTAKMHAGIPLTDDDRWPWLDRLNSALGERDCVLACSALKGAYRSRLVAGVAARIRLVHLRGDQELIAARLRHRTGHYMNPALLDSQFAALEAPADAIEVGIDGTPGEIVAAIVALLEIS